MPMLPIEWLLGLADSVRSSVVAWWSRALQVGTEYVFPDPCDRGQMLELERACIVSQSYAC